MFKLIDSKFNPYRNYTIEETILQNSLGKANVNRDEIKQQFLARKEKLSKVYGKMEDMFFDETTVANHSTRIVDVEPDTLNSSKKKSEHIARERPIDVYL